MENIHVDSPVAFARAPTHLSKRKVLQEINPEKKVKLNSPVKKEPLSPFSQLKITASDLPESLAVLLELFQKFEYSFLLLKLRKRPTFFHNISELWHSISLDKF